VVTFARALAHRTETGSDELLDACSATCLRRVRVRKTLPVIGAGTVVTEQDALRARDTGAWWMVTPALDKGFEHAVALGVQQDASQGGSSPPHRSNAPSLPCPRCAVRGLGEHVRAGAEDHHVREKGVESLASSCSTGRRPR
jgi:hypothetical protein